MSTTKNNLSGRFFYINKDATPDENINSRMYPMDELLALHMDDATSLHITFEDAGVGDHTVVDITIESGKGREAIKEVIDAMNSTQQIVTLVDRAKQQSVISYWNKGGVAVYEGDPGTFALSGALTVAGAATFATGSQNAAVARTATADGTGTGVIAAGTSFVSVTSADANHIISLPTPVPGNSILLHVVGNGYELRAHDPSSVSLNNVSGSGKEMAVAANVVIRCTCVSTQAWIAEKISNAGAPAGGGTPN